MAHLSSFCYTLPCTKRGLGYFPQGVREGIIASIKHNDVLYCGEYAPFKGIHSAQIHEVLPLLHQCHVGNEFFVDAFQPIYPEPINYLLSMIHAHHAFLSTRPSESDAFVVLSALIEAEDMKEALNQAHSLSMQGFTCLKIKIGRDLEQEIAKIKAIAGLVSPQLCLRLDANKKLSLDEARALLKGLSRINIEYIEEPCTNFTDSQKLYDEFGVALAVDESFVTPFDEHKLITSGAQFFIIKPSRFCSVYHAMSLANLARAHGITPIFSTLFESDFAVAMAALMVTCLGLKGFAHGIMVEGFFASSLYTPPLRSFRGRLLLDGVARFVREFGNNVALQNENSFLCLQR